MVSSSSESSQSRERLMAIGEVAGHKMGDNRLGSCSIADAFVFGRRAGEAISK